MSRIRMDYDDARMQAKKLQAAADRCDEVARGLRSGMGQLPNCWEGASADTFALVIQKQISDMQTMRQRLGAVADHIQRVANELERKEKELADIIQGSISASGSGGGGRF